MKAVECLFWAQAEFDHSWRAHAASLRAVKLISGLPIGAEPFLRAALSTSDSFEAGFNSVFPLESLRDELEFLKEQDFFPMRKNCLLGVCSSFESFTKTYAAALSYEPEWQSSYESHQNGPQFGPRSSGLLLQDTSADFSRKFSAKDVAWKRTRAQFWSDSFPWLKNYAIEWVEDIFWLRNQLTHNADIASTSRAMKFCQASFSEGEKIALGGELLGTCVATLRQVAQWIYEPTPYLEA
jgi:hypothetical protein